MGASTWVTSAVLGVGFHAAVQKFELDFVVPQTVAGLGAVWLAGLYIDVSVFQKPIAESAASLAIAAIIFVASLAVSTVVYRLFFHRLRNFPGPFGAKVSKFYGWYMSRNLQYHFEVEKLHKQYGDVVRTGNTAVSSSSGIDTNSAYRSPRAFD